MPRLETQKLGLKIAVLFARSCPGALHQYRLEPGSALLDPRRTAFAGALVEAWNECPAVGNRLMSGPISAITGSTAVRPPSPGTSFSRSTISGNGAGRPRSG